MKALHVIYNDKPVEFQSSKAFTEPLKRVPYGVLINDKKALDSRITDAKLPPNGGSLIDNIGENKTYLIQF